MQLYLHKYSTSSLRTIGPYLTIFLGKSMTQSIDNPYALYFQASLAGALRGVFGLAFEHPFDTVKTRCQANPAEASIKKVTSQIMEAHGVGGFYSGCIPNGMRVMIKQAYRWPMMMVFPQFFKEHLPEKLQVQYPASAKLATAVSIANLETFIICPLERLKVHLMTLDHKNKGITEFYIHHRKHLGREMIRGIHAVYLRQITSWASFLLTDEKMKNWERRRIQKEELPFFSLMKVSLVVGAVNTAVNMPFDFVKTQMQKAEHVNERSVIAVIKRVYQTNGARALYAGWQVRMVQYMIQSVFTVPLLDYFERTYARVAK